MRGFFLNLKELFLFFVDGLKGAKDLIQGKEKIMFFSDLFEELEDNPSKGDKIDHIEEKARIVYGSK